MLKPESNSRVLQATGINDSHIAFSHCERPLHTAVIAPWHALKTAAKADGLMVHIASGYRSFQQQLTIWNEKAEGLRPLLDADGAPIDIRQLSDEAAVFAILRWSALPGASRHHFGTDMDIYAPNLLPEGYRLQLTQEEAKTHQAPLHDWLDNYLACGQSGFFRPYHEKGQGVAPEPWHLSFGPLACVYQQALTEDALALRIQNAAMAHQSTVLHHLSYIYQHFISIPWRHYPAQSLSSIHLE